MQTAQEFIDSYLTKLPYFKMLRYYSYSEEISDIDFEINLFILRNSAKDMINFIRNLQSYIKLSLNPTDSVDDVYHEPLIYDLSIAQFEAAYICRLQHLHEIVGSVNTFLSTPIENIYDYLQKASVASRSNDYPTRKHPANELSEETPNKKLRDTVAYFTSRTKNLNADLFVVKKAFAHVRSKLFDEIKKNEALEKELAALKQEKSENENISTLIP